jgi:hypothetical protein
VYWTAGIRSRQDKRFFSSPQSPDRFWNPQSLLTNGYQAIDPRGKEVRREADHSSASSIEVKKHGAASPLPHISLLCGKKVKRSM